LTFWGKYDIEVDAVNIEVSAFNFDVYINIDVNFDIGGGIVGGSRWMTMTMTQTGQPAGIMVVT
jgi:hypothetical protein